MQRAHDELRSSARTHGERDRHTAVHNTEEGQDDGRYRVFWLLIILGNVQALNSRGKGRMSVLLTRRDKLHRPGPRQEGIDPPPPGLRNTLAVSMDTLVELVCPLDPVVLGSPDVVKHHVRCVAIFRPHRRSCSNSSSQPHGLRGTLRASAAIGSPPLGRACLPIAWNPG